MSKRKRDWSMSASGEWVPAAIEAARSMAGALPPITRKITACTACRKQKIKCDMPDETPPCTRCKKRGVECVLNKSLQALLDDQKQTELLQCDVRNIHETMARLCEQLKVDPPRPLVSANQEGEVAMENGQAIQSDTDKDNDNACELSPPSSPSAVQAPIDTFLDIAKLGSPTSADTPHSGRQRRPAPQQDLISKGIITFSVAEVLVERYFSRLDHFLYGIASQYKDINSLRQTSPVLFAVICTVSALHDSKDQTLYEVCNREFRRLVSKSLFEKRDIEYLRALCIGSFWLADASRILSSDAVRRAADVRLHRHFYHVINSNNRSMADSAVPQVEGRDRIRLWYLLFVCDQHLSILHNRDGLIRHEKEPLVNWQSYLSSDCTNDSDVRIMSQVGLLLMMSQIRDAFGSEQPEQVPKSLAVQLNHFARQLDEWFMKFSALFKPNPRIGDFPRKGLQMHYQFGKLYLGQHVFRGLKSDPIPMHFLSAASMAHEAAMTIFDMILTDEKLQESLVGVPHYFHIMIAFAGHFILEVCNKYSEQLMIDIDNNFQLIGKVLAVFTNLPTIPQHPICRMTSGLSRKMFDCAANMGKGSAVHGMLTQASGMHLHLPGQVGAMTQDPTLAATQMSPNAPFEYPVNQIPPPVDEFTYQEFGEFNFPDMQLNFLT